MKVRHITIRIILFVVLSCPCRHLEISSQFRNSLFLLRRLVCLWGNFTLTSMLHLQKLGFQILYKQVEGAIVLGNRALGCVGLGITLLYHKTANRPNPITCTRIWKVICFRLALCVSLSGVSFAHNRFAQPENVLNNF